MTENPRIPGRRLLVSAIIALAIGYSLCGTVLVFVLTLTKPQSDASAGLLLLGEGVAGLLGTMALVFSIVSMVRRSRGGVPFSAGGLIVCLAAVLLLGIVPTVTLAYIVASTPFV